VLNISRIFKGGRGSKDLTPVLVHLDISEIIEEQAGADLGQAQLKLKPELSFT